MYQVRMIMLGVIVVLGGFVPNMFGAQSTAAMLVIDGNDLSNGFDHAQHDRLVSMGYKVTLIEPNNIGRTFTKAVAETFDLMIISESIGSFDADPLIGAKVPILHNESFGWDNFGFTTGTGYPDWIGGTTKVDIVNGNHPIVVDANLNVGPLQFYKESTVVDDRGRWSVDSINALAPGGKLIAQVEISHKRDYQMVVFAFDKGAKLANGTKAASRIVGFPLPGHEDLKASEITDEGWALWKAAIRWLDPESGDKSILSTGHINGSDVKPLTPPAKNYRYVICTDMTHDDDNSLIRLLHYANEIDIEAIIVTDQGPESIKIEDWPNKMWNRALEIIDAYGQVEDNLRLHDPDFPSAEYIRSITKKGKGFAQRMSGSMDKGNERFWDYVGESRDSEGSAYLQKVFDKKDDRPIYVAFWGGPITFAQAMWRYQQNHTEQEVQKLLEKLIFHCISFQDVTFDYFVDLDAVGKEYFKNRFYGDYEGKRLIPSMMLADIHHFWRYIRAVDENIVHENSGPLGDLYDKGGEGDTPAFLNLISMNLGLSDIAHPSYGGWGDMFFKKDLPNFWFADREHLHELMRWLPQTNNSFYARCKWEQNDFASTNHAPVAAFDQKKSTEFVYLSAHPGDTVKLSAKGSSDPDGDKLTYKWWRYDKADSYEGELVINNSDASEASFILPADIKDKNIHIILEVQDDGEPILTGYRRIIISNKP